MCCWCSLFLVQCFVFPHNLLPCPLAHGSPDCRAREQGLDPSLSYKLIVYLEEQDAAAAGEIGLEVALEGWAPCPGFSGRSVPGTGSTGCYKTHVQPMKPQPGGWRRVSAVQEPCACCPRRAAFALCQQQHSQPQRSSFPARENCFEQIDDEHTAVIPAPVVLILALHTSVLRLGLS